jgi:hypothetical protein
MLLTHSALPLYIINACGGYALLHGVMCYTYLMLKLTLLMTCLYLHGDMGLVTLRSSVTYMPIASWVYVLIGPFHVDIVTVAG